jgi:hypothetical protein
MGDDSGGAWDDDDGEFQGEGGYPGRCDVLQYYNDTYMGNGDDDVDDYIDDDGIGAGWDDDWDIQGCGDQAEGMGDDDISTWERVEVETDGSALERVEVEEGETVERAAVKNGVDIEEHIVEVVASAKRAKDMGTVWTRAIDDYGLGEGVLQLRGGAGRIRCRKRGPRAQEAVHRRFGGFLNRMRLARAPKTIKPCEVWTKSKFSVLHVNIRGFISHCSELVARLRTMRVRPTIICLNETFLDCSVGEVELEGYSMIGRRDRRDGRRCGGVAVFAVTNQADRVTLLKDSIISERLWILVHTDLGPYLIGAWYRPPVQGEVDSIKELREEWAELSLDAVGTVIIGDLNVHHKKWLRRSARNSVEGETLHQFCLDHGLQQLVKEATREQYLLDLVITDIDEAKCKVLPKVADHECVLVYLDLQVPKTEIKKRVVWRFAEADWDALRTKGMLYDWSKLDRCSADQAAELITRELLRMAEECIPKKKLREKKMHSPMGESACD